MTKHQKKYPATSRRISGQPGTQGGNPSQGNRARQLADIAGTGDEDNAEIAAAELRRDYPDFAR